MAARPKTVYRGNRKYSWIITLVVFVLVILIITAVWLFYYLQRYLVYDKDRVRLVLPAERAETFPTETEPTGLPAGFTPVDVEIVVDPADYSDVQTSAGEGLSPIHAIFVSAENVKQGNLDFYAAGLGDFNAIVLELKGPDGMLRYRSGIPFADSYGVNGALELGAAVEALKAQDVRVVAQLSALVDGTMAVRNAPIALQDARSGEPFRDADGRAWLDPYSETLRAYLTALLRDLHDLGFDEVILGDLWCPDNENVRFSQVMTETPDRVSAVSSLALYLRKQADEIGITLSAVVDPAALVAGTNEAIGQDPAVFFKAFDRVTFDMSGADYTACFDLLSRALDRPADEDRRIVPSAAGFSPDFESFIVR